MRKQYIKMLIGLFLFIFLNVAMLYNAHGQVLISLLLGDKLNSDQIEFGLEGGMNRSYLTAIEESKGMNNFDLGFYFHINLKNSTYFSTGVLVKNSVGAGNINPYLTGDNNLDSIFEGGTIQRKINYFYVPFMLHQRFNNRIYLEGGFQLGLRSKAKDIFKNDILGNEITYTIENGDLFKRIDGGVIGGVGYKFKQQVKSLSAGVKYYYGLWSIYKEGNSDVKNSAFFFFVKLPIGAGKASENKQQKSETDTQKN